MAFSITTLKNNSGDPMFYELGFRTIIETHLNILKYTNFTMKRSIDGSKVYQYEGDFYGLLAELNVPLEHHWIFLRVNGMFNPNEFGRVVYDPYGRRHDFNLLIPSDDYIGNLLILYKSTRR